MKLTNKRRDEALKSCSGVVIKSDFCAGWAAAKEVAERSIGDVDEGFEVRPVNENLSELWRLNFEKHHKDLDHLGDAVEFVTNVRNIGVPLMTMEKYPHTLKVWGNGSQPYHYNGPTIAHCFYQAALDLPKK